jgi:hypothetical protein
MLDIILAPDVYVNASVALGSAPDKVVQRILGQHKGESKTTGWILERVRAMLASVPSFKEEAVDAQLDLIRDLVQVIDDPGEHDASDWEAGLVAAAKAAGVKRVVTDHPDLLEKGSSGDIEFVSTDGWVIERTLPPPPPEPSAKDKPEETKPEETKPEENKPEENE